MPSKINYAIGEELGASGIVFNGNEFLLKKHRYAEFICHCGKRFNSRIESIKFLKTRSCGCIWKESLLLSIETHGESRTPLYKCYGAMKSRCKKPNNPKYLHYGGRGIEVCEAWNVYENFSEWAKSSGYKKGLTLDRKDNNKGYYPENCRWVSRSENSENTRMSYFWITPDGEFSSLKKACEFYGKDIHSRFRNKNEGYLKKKKYENNRSNEGENSNTSVTLQSSSGNRK